MKQQTRIKLIKSINNYGLVKEADFSSFLPNYFSSIIDKNNPTESILNIVGTGIAAGLFGLSGGAIAAILNEAGINLSSLLSSLKNVLKSFFAQNPTITNENVDQVAQDLANKTIQDSNVSQQALQTEITAAIQNEIIKNSAPRVLPYSSGGLLDSIQSNWILRNVFQGLSKKTIGGFITGLLFTLVKALLVGGGLTMGAKYVAEKIRGNAPAITQTPESQQPTQPTQTTQPEPEKKNTLLSFIESLYKPSGKGEVIHKNDADQNNQGDYAWYIPSSGDLTKTLYNWVFEIYPDIPDNVEQIIYNRFSQASKPVVDLFSKWNPDLSSPEIRIPNNFLTRKQIVDQILSSITLQ